MQIQNTITWKENIPGHVLIWHAFIITSRIYLSLGAYFRDTVYNYMPPRTYDNIQQIYTIFILVLQTVNTTMTFTKFKT